MSDATNPPTPDPDLPPPPPPPGGGRSGDPLAPSGGVGEYDTAPPPAPAPPPDAAAYAPRPISQEPLPYAGATGYPGPYVGPPADQNAKTMGMLSHLLSLAGIIIPFGNIIGPLIIWQMKKAEHPFIDDQGKESVNFQILITIGLIISALLICVVVGFFLLPVVGLVGLIFSILGGIKANNGEAYRYPFNIRFIK